MHDPSFLALSVRSPILHRERWGKPPEKRWALGRSMRTHPEHIGEPTYPWWALHGYSPVVAGRRYGWHGSLIDVWHDEPGGRAKWHDRRVQWHTWIVTVRTPANGGISILRDSGTAACS